MHKFLFHKKKSLILPLVQQWRIVPLIFTFAGNMDAHISQIWL